MSGIDGKALWAEVQENSRKTRECPVADEALRPDIRRLCRSRNAAIATEAGRLFGALERRRMGDGGDGA